MPDGDPLVYRYGETGICCYGTARDIVDANFPLRPILQDVDYEVHSMEAGPIARSSFYHLSSTLKRMFRQLSILSYQLWFPKLPTMLATRYAE